MIRRIYLKNVGVFSEAAVEPDPQLTIITGETGAGKSTLVEALRALTGGRWTPPGTGSAVVEMEVDAPSAVLEFLQSEGVDAANPLIIRRQRTPAGRSRTFINDQPVPLATLQAIAPDLVDIHSQHQALLLRTPHFHLEVLDAFAQSGRLRTAYSDLYQSYVALRRQLRQLHEAGADDLDYLRFLRDELAEVNLSPAEFEALEEALRRAEHAEQIAAAVQGAVQILEEGDDTIADRMATVVEHLREACRYDERLGEAVRLLEQADALLREVVWRLRENADEMAFSPEQLEEHRRLRDRIYRLMLKHDVSTFEALLGKREEVNQRLEALEARAERIASLQDQIRRLEPQMKAAAEKLSAHRRTHLNRLAKAVEKTLARLMMPRARVQLTMEPTDDWTPYGTDRIRFLFSANPGMPPTPVESTASGGEISRLMLAIKWIVGQRGRSVALILDEIDTGISGEAAAKVAEMIADMARHRQVVVVSHSPQTAALPGRHLHIEKRTKGETTTASIRTLSDEERIEEISRLIAGAHQTPEARSVARQLLQRRGGPHAEPSK